MCSERTHSELKFNDVCWLLALKCCVRTGDRALVQRHHAHFGAIQQAMDAFHHIGIVGARNSSAFVKSMHFCDELRMHTVQRHCE